MLWLRALIWAVLLPGTMVVLVPYWLVSSGAGPRLALGPVRWLGLPLVLIGVPVLVSCIFGFARRGRGTLSPLDPPRRLVVAGLYRWVRNPMYLGAFATLIGIGLWTESGAVLLFTLGWATLVHLFVLLYEEPRLTQMFGPDYQLYRARVRRWVPRRPTGGQET